MAEKNGKEFLWDFGRGVYAFNRYKMKFITMCIVEMGILAFILCSPELKRLLGFTMPDIKELERFCEMNTGQLVSLSNRIVSIFLLLPLIVFITWRIGEICEALFKKDFGKTQKEKREKVFDHMMFFSSAAALGLTIWFSKDVFSDLVLQLVGCFMIHFLFWVLGGILAYSWERGGTFEETEGIGLTLLGDPIVYAETKTGRKIGVGFYRASGSEPENGDEKE